MMEDLITVLIRVCAGLLAVLIGYLGLQLKKWLQTKLKVTDNDYLTALISELCEAAQQIYKESGSGDKRRAYVIALLQDAGHVITEYINAKIEAKVYEINQDTATLETAFDEKVGGTE